MTTLKRYEFISIYNGEGFLQSQGMSEEPNGTYIKADDYARGIKTREEQINLREQTLAAQGREINDLNVVVTSQRGLIGKQEDEIKRLEVDLKELQGRYDQARLLYDGADKSAREAIEQRDRLRELIGALGGGDGEVRVTVSEKYPGLYDVGIYYNDDYSGDDLMAFSMEQGRADALAALLREGQGLS